MKYRSPILVPAIIGLNVIVYLAWHGFFGLGEHFMYKNFLVSWESLQEGRYWTLLTAAFSHNTLVHILINMFVLNSFGSVLEIALGKVRFLLFYLVAGVFSSFAHAVVSASFLHQPDLPCLGASGAIAGCVLVFALSFPEERILLFGIVPLPALWGALAFVALDLYGLFEQSRGGGLPIGHGAHLGGAFVGFLFYLLYLRKFTRRRVRQA